MNELDRRRFLKHAGLTGAGALAGAGTLGASAAGGATPTDASLRDGAPGDASVADPAALMAAIPFHGVNQAGITTPRQPSGCWASFDVTAGSRAELIGLFKRLTSQAAFLTAGGTPPDPQGSYAPPTDSGTLGDVVPADGLTITVAVGSTCSTSGSGSPAASRCGCVSWSRSPTTISTRARPAVTCWCSSAGAATTP
jgi:deferrochelatase/peroxidase EfeB